MITEKQFQAELNLIISNKVGSYISQYLTNIEIIYTRTDDSFVSLDDRVAKANIKKASSNKRVSSSNHFLIVELLRVCTESSFRNCTLVKYSFLKRRS